MTHGFDKALASEVRRLGEALLADARGQRRSVLSSRFWSDKLMDWAMQDPAFKVQLFRFIDCYPALQSPQSVHEHLQDYLSQPGISPPPGLGLGMKAGGLFKGAFAKTIAGRVTKMAQNFIVGTDALDALPQLRKQWDGGLAFSVDLLGEACVSDAEAAAFREQYLDLLRELPPAVDAWPANRTLDQDHLGPIPRTNVSIKISSLHANADAMDFDHELDTLAAAIAPILEAAERQNAFVNFDMEEFALKDLTLALFMRCAEQHATAMGIAMQAYLRSGESDAATLIDWSKRTGRQVTVRLVKGAYWDYENLRAEQMGWPSPVWPTKRETDACFERMAAQLIGACPKTTGEGGTKPALGSHNARSIAAAMAMIEHAGLPPAALELQMLHGMADELKTACVQRGLRVREYLPVGAMIPGMAYLVRRLLENTSNESWLRAGFAEEATPEQLLASPHETSEPLNETPRDEALHHALSAAHPDVGDGKPFISEPPRNFAVREQRDAFAKAIGEARVTSIANDATPGDAAAAAQAASEAFPAWRDTPAAERAAVLTRAAAIMRDRRDELAGLVLREAGKPWREADGEVCEAIDFCAYYAREAVGLFEPRRLGRFVAELDEHWHQPRGVAAVISPWNFPLAILCGMSTAALVCGNTVVVKPAEQTPGIAKVFVDILREAGCPAGVLHLLCGPGETVGAALVRDPHVALIAFTGSKAVGLDILQAAGHTPETQPFVKRVVCEMGGKNAIIVDASADLDQAVIGVRGSAFGYAGQKCSACSRVIVHDDIHDAFVERLVASTRSLVVGDPANPGTHVGPVIDEEAAAKIASYVEIARAEGDVVLAGDAPAIAGKPFVMPHIVTGITAEHRLANEEVFGPVLAVMRAGTFDEAIAIANSTPYKLTGGVYSRKPSHLAQARRDFRVGNLYLNRGTTGALVGRQPFGGFGMSGVGSKAGGPDYLKQFVEPRACCENTMRRGFAPE